MIDVNQEWISTYMVSTTKYTLKIQSISSQKVMYQKTARSIMEILYVIIDT